MSEASFRSNLRSPVRGLWTGVLDFGEFLDAFILAIRVGFTGAFHAGLKEGGIKPEEMTADEIAALNNEIAGQFGYISSFGQAIMDGSKANGGLLRTQFQRLEMWVNNYRRVYELGLAMANGDQKMRWDLGATEKHCSSCAALAGKVKRASYWREHIMPRSRALECRGYRCDCRLTPTDEPMSRGPLPGGF